MAMKRKNTEFVQMKGGDTAEGYLVSVGLQLFPAKAQGAAPSEVPTMILQREDGTRFKLLLGTTVKEEVGLLSMNTWTKVVKPKAMRQTRGGNNVVEWELYQDDDKVLRAQA